VGARAKLALKFPALVPPAAMRPGLPGSAAGRRIRAEATTALLPVVLVTSLDPTQERVKGIEAGADDFLSKPINQPELFAGLRSLLGEKSFKGDVGHRAGAVQGANLKLHQTLTEPIAHQDRLPPRDRLWKLKRFFSPAVADGIVSAGEKSILSPHRREISYVFVDLRGFTAFTDSVEPEEVETALREYHDAMGKVIAEHGGTLDRFAGDGILVFFNDPVPVSEPG